MNTEVNEHFTDVILENIPGLKSFGAYQAGYLLKDPMRIILPKNLEHFDTCLRYSDDLLREDIAVVFPKLNSLSFNFEWRYFRRSVAKINLFWLYKEVVATSWVKNLTTLKLNYFPRQFLNFSILAVNCPKLKSLSLAHIFHGTKDPDSYDVNDQEKQEINVEQLEKFQELENLEVIIYEKINDDQPFFDILKLAHKTIQNLTFRIYEREYFSVLYLISIFFKLEFPFLKRLLVDMPHKQDSLSETAILDFIEHCPQLSEYGFVPDDDLLKKLQNECDRKNFCIKIFQNEDYY